MNPEDGPRIRTSRVRNRAGTPPPAPPGGRIPGRSAGAPPGAASRIPRAAAPLRRQPPSPAQDLTQVSYHRTFRRVRTL